MSILKTYDILWKGLSNGAHHFDFEVDDRFFAAFEDSEIKGGNITISVDLDKSATVLQLEVYIDGTVTVPCDRCLGDVNVPVEYDGELKVKFSDEINDYDGDIMWISQSDGELHLAQYIYESIVLGLPYQKVHEEDENGNPMCDKDMLARFKIVSQEDFDRMEPEEEVQKLGDSPEMEKLLKLKQTLEEKEK